MPENQHAARRAQLWLGTLVEITAEGASAAIAETAIAAAFAAVARVHHALTLHDPQSELRQVNHRAASGLQAVSADLRVVLACALELAERSEGAFDPTVGGDLAALHLLPPQALADREACWHDVRLTETGVRFARPLVLDFGGIAKGHAVDCAIAALRREGIVAGRVNAGGDLRVFGAASEVVHVRTGGPQGIVLPLAMITDAAVATSAYGGSRRGIAQRWATPLIDPQSRLPKMSTRTVSVVAPTCMVADALTKVVALRGSAAAGVLRAYGASASLLSPAAGRWRCTQVPPPVPTQRQRGRPAVAAVV